MEAGTAKCVREASTAKCERGEAGTAKCEEGKLVQLSVSVRRSWYSQV